VSASTALPLSASAEPATIRFPGAPGNSGDPQRDDVLADVVAVRASYVESLGMHLVAGRAFETARPRDTVEALIDQRLATRFFPNGTPVGGTISVNGKPLRVIGAVNQARLYSLYEDGRPQVLVRAEDWTPFAPYFVARVDGHPQALVPEVRRVIRQIDPRIPVSAFRPMDELVMDAQRQHRLSAVLTGGFALGAVLLVSMGLFGMVAGSIVRRSGELALRIVLGASYRRVLNSVFGEGALLVALGVLVAIPGVYAAGGLVRGMLVGVPPWDPITLVGVALGMALVTWLACYVPARRVLAIDPAAVLRKE
jgi:ABC-type antimicrobial peptide transport system permease subunit